MADNSDIPANLLSQMSPSDITQFRQAQAAYNPGRDAIARAMMTQQGPSQLAGSYGQSVPTPPPDQQGASAAPMTQPLQQQALSGGQIQYRAPTAPTGVAPQAGNADIPASLLARMSPTDIALFRKASAGQAVPTGVAGPYGGGAMGQPQIPSGYNAFSGAGLPPTNIGQGGLTPPDGGSNFAGGGSVGGGGAGGVPYPYVQGPYPMPNVNNPNWGSYDIPFTGHSFDERFPGGGGSSVVPQGPQAPQVREGSS